MRQAAEAAIPLRLGELPELILRDRDIYVVIRRAGGAARCAAPRLETSRSEERLHRRVPVDEGRRWRRRHRENGCWCSRNKLDLVQHAIRSWKRAQTLDSKQR